MTSLTIRLLASVLATGTFAASASAPSLLVSDALTGRVQQYTVRPADSLTALAARFGVGSDTIAAANAVRAGKLAAGQSLTIDNRHVIPVAADANATILINVPQRMLFTRRADGTIAAFPVAVGKADWPTPIGPFRVVVREEHPTWDVPVSIQGEMRRNGQRVITRMPPGPRNPLGDYWIGLSFRSLGIHGTPFPSSIYRFVSHGCVRLHPEDIEAVYREIAVGATGAIVYEPVLLAVTAEGPFLEAHRDVYRRGAATIDQVRSAARAAGVDPQIDWARAADVLRRREGIARVVGRSSG
jgi:L,D-transpeptidase ErfK/SrfK